MPFPTHFQPYPHDTYNMLSLASKKRMKMLNSKKSIFGPNKIQKKILKITLGCIFCLGAVILATVSPMNLRKKFHRLTYICSIWSQENFLNHTHLLFQNGAFWRPKTRFEAVLSSKVLLKQRFIRTFSIPKVVKGLCAKLFAISSSSTFENGDVGGSALAKGASNLRRRKNFVQHNEERKQTPCSGTYRQHIWMFAFVRKIFKAWGASASRACAGRRPAPPYLEILSFKRTKTNMLPIRPWTRGVVSVSHYVEQSFFDGLNWKLPLRVRFPHVPIFKCRRRTNCEKFGADRFFCCVLKMFG